MSNPTCDTCRYGDRGSEDEPCNGCAVVDGLGSRLPVRWAAKPWSAAVCDCGRTQCADECQKKSPHGGP